MQYYRHHIIPLHEWRRRINPGAARSDKDFNSPDNVVWLTLEQHAQAHLLLFELNAYTEDFIAGRGIAGVIPHEKIVLEVCRMNGLKVKGLKRSPETKEKQRLAAVARWSVPGARALQRARNLGINNPCYGKKNSTESNLRRSATLMGRTVSTETRKKMSKWQLGIPKKKKAVI